MNSPIKKLGQSDKCPLSLRHLFVPTLLCLALFPASFALATKSGGYENTPNTSDYGNKVSLTDNDVWITGETISGNVFGAYTTENNPATYPKAP